jgi:3-isopropylmalate/(R)-2-methylmalate dehydratase small subunit
MKNRIEGHVCRLGHDAGPLQAMPESISGGKYSRIPERDPLFESTLKLKKGEIIVAGRNFGRDPHGAESIEALKALEVPCVIAASFARRFYRDAINGGLPVVECPEAFEAVSTGEQIAVDFERREITFKRGAVSFPAYPDTISKILASGGLLAYARKAMGK